MIKIAQLTKNLSANGITNVVMNYSENLDKNKFEITIICGSPVEEMYRKECEEKGIQLIELPDKINASIKYYRSMWMNLNNKFDVVHVHGNSTTISVELMMAMIRGIKVRIAHCHNSTCDNIRIHNLLFPLFKHLYTSGFACSKLAGEWMFRGYPYHVLTNSFETKRFIFNNEKRQEIRECLGLQDKFVIGNVARFNNQKNHEYLLKIFESVASEREDAHLLLVGNGPKLDEIKELIAIHPYKERITYYGITNQVEEIYNASDVFVLPSKHEGLGIVFIEAQINGLPVITSDRVPKEVSIANRAQFLPLEVNIAVWREAILNIELVDRQQFYKQNENRIQEYDIGQSAKYLEKLYSKMVGK